MAMHTILWQTEYARLKRSFENGALTNDVRGGDIYEFQAALYLSNYYKILFDNHALRKETTPSFRYWLQLRSRPPEHHLCIMSPSVVLHGTRRGNAKKICVIHHIYLKNKRRSLKGALSVFILHQRLKLLDGVVVCSEFWRDYFFRKGCRNIEVIYNCFDSDEFHISTADTDAFCRQYRLPPDKPLVYIGLADKSKGIVEVYEALKDQGYTLITTGPKHESLHLPVRHLFLDRHDYLCLLKASALVVAMSRVEEGWSRIAHEALLCKTPVIGSGTGGMGELLRGAGQTIAHDTKNLAALAEQVMKNKEQFGAIGYDFARQFGIERFQHQWAAFVAYILKKNTS